MTKKFQRTIEDFTCCHCGASVSGNGYTNHCFKCLYSLHVDVHPGDRAAECHGPMKPIQLKPKTGSGLQGARILHRCERCGYEKWNEASEFDDSESLFALLGKAPH
ncbi:MAG: RNHCP domain-containing protein [Bdellovibrionales bacterium]|nr:RNHCP domain-containing protein [Bdellovibrionales bacterium]